jgi:hypothetical protein
MHARPLFTGYSEVFTLHRLPCLACLSVWLSVPRAVLVPLRMPLHVHIAHLPHRSVHTHTLANVMPVSLYEAKRAELQAVHVYALETGYHKAPTHLDLALWAQVE